MSENGLLWSTPPGDGEELHSVPGIKDDCFHCSSNPHKFLPLPKEKQPYCTRCFESMFNFDTNVSNNNNNVNGGASYLSQPPSSLPKPPAFKPPEIPPKPSGKSAILYSTLPQPFQPKSATPSISPVPSSTRSVSITPPPSPPSECDPSFYEGTNVDLSLPPPPPPLLETNLDSLESERNSQNSPYSSSSPSSGSVRLGAYSPSLRYDSPTPIQINGHQDHEKDFHTKTPSNNSSNLPSSPLPSRTSPVSPPQSAGSDNSIKKTSTLKGGGHVKFDYRLIAAVPSAMADWRDPEEESEKPSRRQHSGSSSSSLEKDSIPSKSYTPKPFSSPVLGQSSRPSTTAPPSVTNYFKSSSPIVNVATTVKQSATSPPLPPPPPPLVSSPAQQSSIPPDRITSRTPGFQGIRPGPGSWASSGKPAAAIGAAINRAAGIEPPVKSTPAGTRTLVYNEPTKTTPPHSRTPSQDVPKPTNTTAPPPPPPVSINSNRPTGIRAQVSTEPEESHLDQINSIFKMGSMKPKPIDPYAPPEQHSPPSLSSASKNPNNKPAIAATKPSLKCAKCSCNLLGKTVQSNTKGEFVCAPCYKKEQAELAGCVKCGGEFTPENQMVTYKAQGWHHKCFACDKCSNPIGTKTFCKQPEGLYCSDCYFDTKGRICVKCKTYLKSAGFIFRNQPWHHECFLCHGCQKSLGDEEIYSKDESPYCAKCYDQNFTEKCAKCFKVLTGETVEYESKQYHDDCFCCFQCTRPIGSASFFPREGQVYCDVCFTRKFAKTCKQCKLVISPTHGAGLVYKEQHFHKDCFNCTHCHKHLGNNMVHSTKTSDDPFCENCYDELFAKRCTSCTNIISGVIGTRFMSYQGRHWHVECFNCKLCQTSLENRKFVPSQGEMLCIACSKFNPYSQRT